MIQRSAEASLVAGGVTETVPVLNSPRTGLLAHGAAGSWHLSVDEHLDREAHFLQLDWPGGYLYFELSDLAAISVALKFLESSPGEGRSASKDSVCLGRFQGAPVCLRWDTEDQPRCLLVIGSDPQSMLFLNLLGADISMLVGSLQQVAEELHEDLDATDLGI